MITAPNKRVVPVPCIVGCNGSTRYYAAVGGPVGSTTMMWACVAMLTRVSSSVDANSLFTGTNLSVGVGGWGIHYSAGALNVLAVSGGGVVTSHQTVTGAYNVAQNVGVPIIIIGQLVGGNITSSVTGRVAAAATPIVGYTAKPAGQRTAIGAQDALTSTGNFFVIGDCAFLNGYDGTGFVSSVFGNGLAGINAMWCEDLQQGRPLTWPRAAVANSDWYWRAADIASPTPGVTWTDRYSAFALTRSTPAFPQGGSFAPRF